MEIIKVLNNNVAHVRRNNQTEYVVMGRGLAFQKKPGDTLDATKIEKEFIITSDNFVQKLTELISELPYDVMIMTQHIIDLAEKRLDTKLNSSLFLSLSDHINFTLERMADNLTIQNALIWEVKKFYTEEYQVAKEAVERINASYDVNLDENEAASIALHILNARQENQSMEKTIAMTEYVRDITNIAKYHFGVDLDESSMNYHRFITHLRYFIYRLFQNEFIDDGLDELYEQVQKKYPESFACAVKIKKYLEIQFETIISKDEMAYFTIHLHRVFKRSTKENS